MPIAGRAMWRPTACWGWALASLLGTLSLAQAQTTTFNGTADNNWFNAGNWSAGVPTAANIATISGADAVLGGTGTGTAGVVDVDGDRSLTVTGGSTLNLLRTRIGSETGGSMVVSGAGTSVVNTGISGSGQYDIIIGIYGATGTLTVSDHGLFAGPARTQDLLLGYSGGTGNIILKTGGTLAAGDVRIYDHGSISMDGGVFRALVSTTNVFSNFSAADFVLGAGGGTIDTNGFNITATNVLSGTGGLSKTGAGTLVLSGASTYAGRTTINEGILSLSGSLASTVIEFTLTDSAFGQFYVENASFSFDGTVVFDLAGVSLEGSWTLFDGSQFGASSLTSALAVTSDLGEFVSVGDTTYRLSEGGFEWTFDRSAGTLTAIAVPEPQVYVLLVGGVLFLTLAARRRNNLASMRNTPDLRPTGKFTGAASDSRLRPDF